MDHAIYQWQAAYRSAVWRQIPSNCPFASMKHEGLSTRDFTGPSKSTAPNIKRLKMPEEDLPSLKPSGFRGMIQQRLREPLNLHHDESGDDSFG
jgi:hypothetical protein